jgi:hypothetical protein
MNTLFDWNRSYKRVALMVVMGLAMLTIVPGPEGLAAYASPLQQASSCLEFPPANTPYKICGRFKNYWEQHGGLAQQGYPISEERQEVSKTDGKVYTVQYFERAVFEYHPEQPDPQYQVLLSLLGRFTYDEKYGPVGAPGQRASTTNARKFPSTGKTLGGIFRQYWEQHGGLAQQGYPISEEFTERSDIDGKLYTVQYFERAVFEYHPEQPDPQFRVLLSLLGRSQYNAQLGSPTPGPFANPTDPPTVTSTSTRVATTPTNTPTSAPTWTPLSTNTPTPTDTPTPTITPTPLPDRLRITTLVLLNHGGHPFCMEMSVNGRHQAWSYGHDAPTGTNIAIPSDIGTFLGVHEQDQVTVRFAYWYSVASTIPIDGQYCAVPGRYGWNEITFNAGLLPETTKTFRTNYGVGTLQCNLTWQMLR